MIEGALRLALSHAGIPDDDSVPIVASPIPLRA